MNKTSDVVDIDDSISGARGVTDDDNNDDNDNDDAINNGGGTAIPKRLRLRRGQLWCFGGNVGNDGNCGKGDCDGRGNNKEGDMAMRQQHIATARTTTTTMSTATRDVHQLHKVKKAHHMPTIF